MQLSATGSVANPRTSVRGSQAHICSPLHYHSILACSPLQELLSGSVKHRLCRREEG